MSSSPKLAGLPWLRVIAVLVILAIWLASQREALVERKPQAPVEPDPKPVSVEVIGKEPQRESKSGSGENRLLIRDLVVRDETDRVIHRGDIDLAPTLDRIAAGELLGRFPNDGSAFQNRERRLPRQPPGYYREFVVPTPGERSPGPQRLVIGREGEVYYTHDHYRTFRKVR
jgi:ribonuclease T1